MNYIVELEDVWKKYLMKKDRPEFKEFVVNLPKSINGNSKF